ncbi:glycosyltransferase [Paenibacillus sp. CC-CFT747]|nr:glycosyltransferase [Paenibacillus sp. CC-CFT747]
MNAIRHQWKRGRRHGRRAGRADGFRLGRCEGALTHIPETPVNGRDVHVLYVREGFEAIDSGIEAALRRLVRDVTSVSATEEIAGLASHLRPDLVLVLNATRFPVEQADRLRDMGILTAVWFLDDPYRMDWDVQLAAHYDYVFTNEISCVSPFQEAGSPRVFYLPLAVHPAVYYPRRMEPAYRSDVCFIGTAFANRRAFFDRLAPYLAGKKVFISGWYWDRLARYDLLKSSIRQDKLREGTWLSAEETAKYYNGAKIVINLHREDSAEETINSRGIPALSINPRTFEISGCGVLQLTDDREELHRMYTGGQDLVTYRNPEDLAAKLDYYLSRDEERLELAVRGLVRTRSRHTYLHRMTELLSAVWGG